VPIRNDQARFFFRILAGPVAVLMWLAALLLGFQAIARRDVEQTVVSLVVCLLALLFTFVILKGRAPRWLYFILTWGERP